MLCIVYCILDVVDKQHQNIFNILFIYLIIKAYLSMYSSTLRRNSSPLFSPQQSKTTDLYDLNFQYPRTDYHNTKRKQFAKSYAFQTDPATLQKIYFDRLIIEGKLQRQKVKQLTESRLINIKTSSTGAHKFQKQFHRPSSCRNFHKSEKNQPIKEDQKRCQSSTGKRVQSEILEKSCCIRKQQNAEQNKVTNCTAKSLYRQIDQLSKAIDKQEKLKQYQINETEKNVISKLEEQIKYLKQQLEEKNKIIVDLEFRSYKPKANVQQNLPSQDNIDQDRSTKLQQQVEIIQVKKQLSVSSQINIIVNSPRDRKKLSRTSQYVISIQKSVEQKQEGRQTKQSFFATTADMKKFNIQSYQLKQTLFLDDKLSGSACQESTVYNPSAAVQHKQYQLKPTKLPSRQESLAESIVFAASLDGFSQIQLTLSNSQFLPSPPKKNKSIKPAASFNDSLSLSQSYAEGQVQKRFQRIKIEQKQTRAEVNEEGDDEIGDLALSLSQSMQCNDEVKNKGIGNENKVEPIVEDDGDLDVSQDGRLVLSQDQ